MVNKQMIEKMGNNHPVDEGWWESVLADEETIAKPCASISSKGMSQNNSSNRKSQEKNLEIDDMDWPQANQLYEQDQTIYLVVTGFNRGGLLVNGNGLQGFVPISHLVETPCTEPNNEDWLSSYVGRSLSLKVIECDQERGRIVFSERAALSEPGSRIHLLNRLQPGDCVRGTVTNITDFGVFVDLGGIEGLIHVSEISWGRVHHPSDVLELDQVVDVYIIHIDHERLRVALSLKRMRPNPWETVHTKYYPGLVIEAVVTSIVPFGAFARLEEGLDGLIHVSEINRGSEGSHPGDFLSEGQTILVKVLHVDSTRQRLGLSLETVQPEIS
jgi:small subunit ribosomal protein S1